MMTTDDKVRIIPLGGVSEIGKNMTAIEYQGRILVVDCGLMFPDAELLGVDIVIPDVTYLLENADAIDGLLLTHGHEDHIGAIPYVLRQINMPIWGTSLTIGFLKAKLDEHKLTDTTELNVVEVGDRFHIGNFDIDTIRISHSIPDGFAMAIRLPIGTIVHTGDFKFDQTPADGKVADYSKFAQLGAEGVLALLSDCTNVEKAGYVQSEQVVGNMFEQVFAKATGKIIIATFASNINRIQQAINTASHFGRKVAIAGRSMLQNVEIAERLGYLDVPEGTMMRLEEIPNRFPCEVVVMTTGSQGEPLSALTRIATDEHQKVKVDKGDTVIISASPIPGNEDLVARTINHLFRRGADVIYDQIAPVHVSGHANREELKLMLNLTQPKYVIPVHGESRHVARYIQLAQEMGWAAERVFGLEIGDILEIGQDEAGVVGKVTVGDVLVDGIGVGDVGDIVLRDRRHLANDGVFIIVMSVDKRSGEMVAGPDIVSRGFIFMEEAEDLIDEAKQVVEARFTDMTIDESTELETIKSEIRKSVAKLLYNRTHRRPMVIPVMMEL